MPLRKKPFEPRHHIFYLRLSILGVALFAFVFGIFFRQTEYLIMWWAVTGAVFLGGAGAAIIGGLYWRKGTAAGAWVAMVTGSCLGLAGIMTREIDAHFPFNGVEISFAVALISSATYIVVSFLTCREDFNMDRMLHRGIYAKIAESVGDQVPKPVSPSQTLAAQLIGIDKDFTRGDRWLAISVFVWAILWFVVFVVCTVWNLIAPWPVGAWSNYWLVSGICIPLFITVVVAFWFTWGGLRDMRDFFRYLRAQKINVLDDGTVVDHQNLDESFVEDTSKSATPTVRQKVINRDGTKENATI